MASLGLLLATAAASAKPLCAEPPVTLYIFPAGGQRGTAVSFKVGGMFLNDACSFRIRGSGIAAPRSIARTRTVWFEGPQIPMPASQQKEDYPKDFAGTLHIDANAATGTRFWRVATSQGITPLRKFVVGDLPEIVEDEIDGDPVPAAVHLPVTVNGRIFPREDVDLWTFSAAAGEVISCDVAAAQIDSPLDPHLEIHGSDGRLIAENTTVPGPDAGLRFQAPADGRYTLRIADSDFRGAQSFVYRISLTRGPVVDAAYPLGGRHNSPVDLLLSGAALPADRVRVSLPGRREPAARVHPPLGPGVRGDIALELGDLPEFLEETARRAGSARLAQIPGVLNGRILEPGEADVWQVTAHRGDRYWLDLRAGRLGSMLDSVLTILDSSGKIVAACDDMAAGQTDSQLAWTVADDGTYRIRVEDRLPSRGGPRYAYRLKIDRADAAADDFQLKLPADSIVVERGKTAKLVVAAQRVGSFAGPIALSVEGLPPGVSATLPLIGPKDSKAEIQLKADALAKVAAADVTIRGHAVVGGKSVVRTAEVAADRADPPIDQITVAVALSTPFKFTGTYDQAYTPRGSVRVKHFTIQRNGYAGPFEVCLSDKQVRHLQGVTGPTIVVPAGVDEFDYPLTFAPEMEILRTSRANLMLTGFLHDPDGTLQRVTYTTEEQNEQMVSVVSPGRLTIEVDPSSLSANRGRSSFVRVAVSRAKGLSGAVRLELLCPRHIAGVSAVPVRVDAAKSAAELAVVFADGLLGPFNMPLTVRATMIDSRGYPVVAEAPLSIVDAR